MIPQTRPLLLIITVVLLALACSNENDPLPEDKPDVALDFPYTYSEGETGYSMNINGTLISDHAEILNTLETDKTLSLNFWNGTDYDFAGISWLPLAEGVHETGYNNGKGNGTFDDNNLYMVAKVKSGDKHHYAYSSHAYGYLEDALLPGSVCKVKIRTLEGSYTRYLLFGYELIQFIGVVEGQFAGTFMASDGARIEVTEGQFRIENTLPDGAEIID
ncbi:MAG: hypothetical protein RIC35_04235 [Marinoscillum sp.]